MVLVSVASDRNLSLLRLVRAKPGLVTSRLTVCRITHHPPQLLRASADQHCRLRRHLPFRELDIPTKTANPRTCEPAADACRSVRRPGPAITSSDPSRLAPSFHTITSRLASRLANWWKRASPLQSILRQRGRCHQRFELALKPRLGLGLGFGLSQQFCYPRGSSAIVLLCAVCARRTGMAGDGGDA